MRKVIWERKTKPVPFSNPSALRFRESMRPSLLTRIADRLFDRVEKVAERVDGIDSKYSFGKAATVFFFAAMATGFTFFGEIGRAPHFFGALAFVAFASRAYFEWHKKHPLPPVEQRKFIHEAGAVAHGAVGGAAIVAALMVVQYSLGGSPSFDWFDLTVNGVASGAGVFLLRTGGEPEKPGGQLVTFLSVALMLLASWAAFELLR